MTRTATALPAVITTNLLVAVVFTGIAAGTQSICLNAVVIAAGFLAASRLFVWFDSLPGRPAAMQSAT